MALYTDMSNIAMHDADSECDCRCIYHDDDYQASSCVDEGSIASSKPSVAS